MSVRPATESEIQLQARCWQKLWNQYPSTRRTFFSVPNGGTRDVREMGQLKASGLLPGASDTVWLWNGRGYCIEFKDETGTQDPEQIKFEEAMTNTGTPYYLVRNEQEWDRIKIKILQSAIHLLSYDEEIKLSIESDD